MCAWGSEDGACGYECALLIPWNPSSTPRACNELQTHSNSSSKGPGIVFWPLWAVELFCTRLLTETHTQVHNLKKNNL